MPQDEQSEAYDRAFRRKKDAKKHIYKWILNKIGNVNFKDIDEKTITSAFLNTPKPPSKDIMRKSISVLNHILLVAKRKQLIQNYDFLTLAKTELNKILENKKCVHHKVLITDDFELDEDGIKMLINAVLNSNTNLMNKLLFSFMLLSPQRQGDLRNLRCEKANLQKGFICFNENNNKTGARAIIPLSTQGKKILEIASKISDDCSTNYFAHFFLLANRFVFYFLFVAVKYINLLTIIKVKNLNHKNQIYFSTYLYKIYIQLSIHHMKLHLHHVIISNIHYLESPFF